VNGYKDEKWCKVQGARHKAWMTLFFAVHREPCAVFSTTHMGTVPEIKSKGLRLKT
jgi:hypothetical protein